jgi:hypothetical protein
VELQEILKRIAEGLPSVDAITATITVGNRKTDRATGKLMPGKTFLPGVKTMKEPKFISELVDWWKFSYPADFSPTEAIRTEVPYPDLPSGNDCDIVLSSNGSPLANPEWAIEIKHISFCGDNGIKNDHGVQKMLSPYRKDRALIHDIERLSRSPIAARKAVIGYCFDYSFASCEEALKRHPKEMEKVKNLKATCRENDPINGVLNIGPLVDFADAIFQKESVVKSHARELFSGAWRHPCGGNGTIFGWEVN